MYFYINLVVLMVHEFVITIHLVVVIVIHQYHYDRVLMVHYHPNRVHVNNNPTWVIVLFVARKFNEIFEKNEINDTRQTLNRLIIQT